MSKVSFSVHPSFVAKRVPPVLSPGCLDIRCVKIAPDANKRRRRATASLLSQFVVGLAILALAAATFVVLTKLQGTR